MTEWHCHCHLSGLSPPSGLPLPSLPLGLPYPSDVCPLAIPRLISLRPLPTTFMPTPLCPLVVPQRRHWHPQAWGLIKATMKKWATSPGVRMEMAQPMMTARSQHWPKTKNMKSMHPGTRAEILPTMLAWYRRRWERAQNRAAKTKNTKNLHLGMRVETTMPSWCQCQWAKVGNGTTRTKKMRSLPLWLACPRKRRSPSQWDHSPVRLTDTCWCSFHSIECRRRVVLIKVKVSHLCTMHNKVYMVPKIVWMLANHI